MQAIRNAVRSLGFSGVIGVIGVMVAMASWLCAPTAHATALTAERDTPSRGGHVYAFTQGSNVIYAGSMVAINTSGKAVPAADSASFKVVGRAKATQDNTGSSYSAARTIEVEAGVFRWVNGGSYTDANVGDLAYVSDDQTVFTAASATQDVIAGVIVDVDTSGVWVDTHDIGSQGAASLTTFAASGAATLSSTLDVAGATTVGGTLGVTGASTLAALNATGAANLGSTLKITGALTGSNTVTAAGALIASTRFCTTPATQPLAAGAFTLTVTNAIIDLQPSGVATVTLANATAAGDTCTLINNAGTNVVIADSANLICTGATTLAQWDNITIKARAVDSWVVTAHEDN